VRLWDIETGHQLQPLEGHSDWVNAITLSPDGRLAVTASKDRTLRVWDLETGACLHILNGHKDEVHDVALTPDGRLVVSASKDETVRLWSLKQGKQVGLLQDGASYTDKLAMKFGYTTIGVSPAGRQAVFTGNCLIPMVCDLRTRRNVLTLQEHGGWERVVSFTADGKLAVTGGSGGFKGVSVWDLVTGRCVAIEPHASLAHGQAAIHEPTPGTVYFYEVCNMNQGPTIVTPTRLWHYGFGGRSGTWDSQVTVLCGSCLNRFPLAVDVLNVVVSIVQNTILPPDQSPCLELPTEAWDEPKLLSGCPLCHKPLKFNPFIVDNRGRY